MKNILLAVDETKGSKEAISTFVRVCKCINPERLILLHVEKLEGRSLIAEMLGDPEMATLKETLEGTVTDRVVQSAVKMVIETPRIDGPRVFNVGDGSQNFQKLAIAQMAVEAVPGTELDLVKKDEDPRSYRVNFDRVHTTFGYAITRTASDGVEEVRRLLANRVITDYDDPKYVN